MFSRPSTRTIAAVALLSAGLLSLSACDLGGGTDKAGDTPATTATASASASPSARPSKGTGTGSLPDICTLLSKTEVQSLTSHQVTVMTNEGDPAAATRYCQWQLSGGQLVVMVSRSTRAQFDVRSPEARTVDGVGTAAYELSGHLFVFQNGLVVDVYYSGGTATQNLVVEKRTATTVLPRLAG